MALRGDHAHATACSSQQLKRFSRAREGVDVLIVNRVVVSAIDIHELFGTGLVACCKMEHLIEQGRTNTSHELSIVLVLPVNLIDGIPHRF